jgi:hypothetical protein
MLNFNFFLIPDLAEATPFGPSDMTGRHIIHTLPLSLSSVASLFLATQSVYPFTEVLPSGCAMFLLYNR